MKKEYLQPTFEVVQISYKDVVTISEPTNDIYDPFGWWPNS